MISRFEWYLALKFMRSKNKDGFISVIGMFSMIGIIIGVATLIVVMSVMNGFHKEFLRNILGIQGHITVVNNTGKMLNYDEINHKISAVDNVIFSAPLVVGQGMAASQNVSSGVFVRGMSSDLLFKKPSMQNAISSDVQKDFSQGHGVIIGVALARQLGVRKGDSIKLISSGGNNSIAGFVPRIKTLQIAGVFDVGLYQYNLTTIFMPIDDAQLFFMHNNTVSEIEVMVDDPEKLESVKAGIIKQLGDDIIIVDWKQNQASFLNSLAIERVVMFVILTLIIIVAAFNIVSSMIMLVKDKSRNIAVLRTLGASQASILKIFIISGSFIGFIGTFLGAILGVTFALNISSIKTLLEKASGVQLFDPVIYFLSSLPSDLEVTSVFGICFMSLLFSIMATIYPAQRAAKLPPAQVLRYE